jgi:DNA-binding transcriptional ArsR family regulator
MLRLRTEWRKPARDDVLAALPEAKSVSLARLHVRLLRRGFDIPPEKLTTRLKQLKAEGFVTLERRGRWWLWGRVKPAAMRLAAEARARALAASKEGRAVAAWRWAAERRAGPEYCDRVARVVELRKQGWTYERIGREIGRSKSTVIWMLQGGPSRRKASTHEAVTALTGTTVADPRQEQDKLADRKAAFRRGVENRRTGSEYEARVARIAELRARGWTHLRIGAEVGLSCRAVGRTLESPEGSQERILTPSCRRAR